MARGTDATEAETLKRWDNDFLDEIVLTGLIEEHGELPTLSKLVG
ncbi:MAG: hypothetical protein ABSA39_00020 [Edaphobacter sp.]